MNRIRFFIVVFVSFYSFVGISQEYSIKQIDSLNTLAHKLSDNDPKKAILVSNQAYKASKKLEYDRGLMNSLEKLAYIHYVTGETEKAFQYAAEEEKIALKAKKYFSVSSAARIKAACYSKLGLYDEARKAVSFGLNAADKILEDNDGRHEVKGSLYQSMSAVVYYENNNAIDSIIRYSRKALDEFLKIKSSSLRESQLSTAYQNLGRSYIDFNKLDSASICLDKAMGLAQKHKDLFSEISILFNFGRLSYFKKDYDKAIYYYKESIKKAKLYNEPYKIRDSYQNIRGCYSALGDKEKEQEYSIKYSQLNDSLMALEKAAIKTPLNHILDVKEESFFAQKQRLYYVIGASIILLFIVLYFGYQYYKNYKKERFAKLKQEEIVQERDTQLLEMKLQVDDSFEKVIELAKKDDPLFVTLFKELYPVFYQKLMQTQSDLTLLELKICFYIRLKFSTKEIAEYTFVTPKAIQNRKNRLRKRLGIDNDDDIYTWMEQLDKTN